MNIPSQKKFITVGFALVPTTMNWVLEIADSIGDIHDLVDSKV